MCTVQVNKKSSYIKKKLIKAHGKIYKTGKVNIRKVWNLFSYEPDYLTVCHYYSLPISILFDLMLFNYI